MSVMRIVRQSVLVLAISSNVLAAAYYVWAAIMDGVLTSRSFTSEGIPFAILYFGRGITPILAVAALALTSGRSGESRLSAHA